MVFAVVGVALYLWCFESSRETVERDADTVFLRDTLNMLRQNEPLIVLCVGALVFLTGMFSLQTVAVFYARDVLGDADLYIWLTVVQTAGMLIAAAITPKLIGTIGKKRTFVVAAGVGAVFALGVTFAPASNPMLGIIAYGLLGISLGLINTLMFALQADTVDYGEWKSGVRAEGASYSVLSFMRKAGQGVGGAAAAFAIGIGGYVSGASVQSDARSSPSGWPLAGSPIVTLLIAGVVMLAYPITEKMYRRIIGDLAERRADTAFTPSGSATTASEDRTT